MTMTIRQTAQRLIDRGLARRAAVRIAAELPTDADVGLCDVTPETQTEWPAVTLPGWTADDGNAEVKYSSAESAREACEEYVSGGDWGDDGGSVRVSAWRTMYVYRGTDDRVTVEREEEESHDIDVPTDHAALIRDAARIDGYESADVCGVDPDDHDWTSEGEGGLDENPGVWSIGGTAIVVREHCRRCGLHRRVHYAGSQRNPGEASETYTYWTGAED